jgi:hypothetical protein
MPEITAEIVTTLIEAFRRSGKQILVPTYQQRNGHPVIFAGVCRPNLLQLTGDQGARQMIREHPELVEHFETPQRAVVIDVDTPEDLRMDVGMFDEIDDNRVLAMTAEEKRWFDNIEKALHESDLALQGGAPEDGCLQELLTAIDTAKNLRRSLRGEDMSDRHSKNKKRFIEFLGLGVPCFRPGYRAQGFYGRDAGSEAPGAVPDEYRIELHARDTGKVRGYTLGEIVYEIRCSMVHEGENLNAAEELDQPILVDWSARNPGHFAEQRGAQFIFNGYFLWNRLREVLAKFITVIQRMIDSAERGSFSIEIRPALGSIKPRLPRKGTPGT